MQITLKRPLVLSPAVPGNETTPETPARMLAVLDLNLDALTGADVAMALREVGEVDALGSLGVGTEVPAFLAARAAGVEPALIETLQASDYSAAVQETRAFFLYQRAGGEPVAINLDGITGGDIARVSRGSMAVAGGYLAPIGMRPLLVEELLVKASGLTLAELHALPARRYNASMMVVQGFLLGTA